MSHCGIDVMVERRLSAAEIRGAIARVAGIDPDALALIASLADYPADDGWRAVCVEDTRAAGFRHHLQIDFTPALDGFGDGRAFALGLAAAFDSRCLVSDDRINPYTWVLLGPDGSAAAVSVDPDKLDRDEEFWLDGEAPSAVDPGGGGR